MKINRIVVGSYQTNCYILSIDDKCLIVDPGDNYGLIKKNICNFKLLGILITHKHPDHIGALNDLVNDYNAPIYDIKYQEGSYNIDKFNFNIIYTKGHTDDSISFYFPNEKMMFCGDFIFEGTIGRTDLDTGDYDEMIKSLNKISTYDPSITLYPGHGNKTNLGFEINYNQYFKNI